MPLLSRHTILWKQRSYSRDPDTHRASTTVESTTPIEANVQPARGKEIEFLDEGERTGREVKVYLDPSVDVDATDEASDTPADLLEIDGDDYKVLRRHDHDGVLPHRKVIAQRVE